jgi:hypothetical protein
MSAKYNGVFQKMEIGVPFYGIECTLEEPFRRWLSGVTKS